MAGDPEALARLRVEGRAVALFTRQLAALVESGVSLVPALKALQLQPESPALAQVVEYLIENVSAGHSLSASASRFPQVFPIAFVTMAKVAEQTGQLGPTLQRLSDWLENDYNTYRRVKGALSYPVFVLLFTFALTLLMFWTVMPGLMRFFADMNTPLPLPTKIIMWITAGLRNPAAWAGAVLIQVGMFAVLRDYLRTSAGAANAYRLLLQVPLVGRLVRDSSLARYCAAAASLLTVGVNLQTVLPLAADASGSPLLRTHSAELVRCLRSGGTISEPMNASAELYTHTLTQLIETGENTGVLGAMYDYAASFFGSNLDYQLETLSAALEPLLLGLVTTLVATVILSVFMPLYGSLSNLGG